MNNNKSKKRIAVRLAILMMALALITSCLAVGTLSKYTVGGNGNDKAQVAKWGVRITVTNDQTVFANEYDNTVKAEAGSTYDLVAPGTKNDTGATIEITGKPEVASKVNITLGAVEDVYLETTTGKYYPVVFTLTNEYGNDAFTLKDAADAEGVTCTVSGNVETITGTLADIEKVLNRFSTSTSLSQFGPNHNYENTLTLTWAWEFFEDDATDVLDTALGDLAAGLTPNVDGYVGSNLTVSYTLAITIVQVD